ncbi:MAG TPA: DMT family transporter [Actinomycetota bacterium]|nr:DMT family transporter [Actinomycetota bacterium]
MTYLAALVGILTISFSAALVAMADVSASTAAFYRCAYAVPFLLVGWLTIRRRDRRTRRERVLAVVAGVLFALDLAFWHRAIEMIGTGMSTLLGNTQILFVGVLAWMFFRERPTRAAMVLIPVVLGGVALSSGLGRGDAFGSDPVLGAVFGLLTGLAYAGFLLIFRASNRSLAPSAGPLLDATAGAAVAGLAFAPFDTDFSFAIPMASHLWLLVLAVGVQVVGWLLISIALPRLPSLETSVLLLLQPLAALLWGILFFGEDPSAVQWVGNALILAGVAVLSWRGSVEETRVERPLDAPGPIHEASTPE